ncbi:MAG TPA: CreA family protein [Acidisoma sp.]|uniref:CreA family protein n=1 Tax=Acidisoma sp. TaxID=1872115 RepID=UPI002BB4E3E3|nr:CreA family protein [Acidisoma sp.]HTI00966.1 CreA family protein [Acidisoma sp.]
MIKTRIGAVLLAAGLLGATPALAQTKVGSVDTTFRLLGANDRVVIDRYDDPDVPNASCYVSHAATGGVSGSLGLAEDPSRFSIACRATGPVAWPEKLPDKQRVFSQALSVFFKHLEVYRLLDREKKVVLYLVISSRLKEGSPFNSISAVATTPTAP